MACRLQAGRRLYFCRKGDAMTKEELAQKIKDSNYTCNGINCSECIRVNGFGCCLQCDKKLFVSLVLPAKSKKDKLEKRIEELERRLEQTEKDLADYQFNYPTIKELSKENEQLKAQIEKMKCCGNCKFKDCDKSNRYQTCWYCTNKDKWKLK